MQNLITRFLSGIVYVCLLVGASLWNTQAQLFLVVIFSFFGFKEWVRVKDPKSNLFLPIWLSVLFIISSWSNFSIDSLGSESQGALLNLILLILTSLLIFHQAFTQKTNFPDRLMHLFFGLIYIGFPLLLLPKIPQLFGGDQGWLLVSIFILIWSTDTFAYLVGRFLGKTKLFERISPNKTWEGFAGGAFFTLALSFILHHYIGLMSLGAWLGLASITVVFGTLGDLFESAIKRHFGIKDSGRFLPGHGGILDRIDSLLFVLPAAYFYLKFIEVWAI